MIGPWPSPAAINRLYQGGFVHMPALGLAGTATGGGTAADRLGWVADSGSRLLRVLVPDAHAAQIARRAARPDEMFATRRNLVALAWTLLEPGAR